MFKDRFLLGIVAGILILVAVTFALVWFSPPAGYLPEDSARAAAYNYALALEQGDYAVAYDYLSPHLLCRPKQQAIFEAELAEFPAGVSWKILSERALNLDASRYEVIVEITRFRRTFLFFSDTYTSRVMLEWEKSSPGWSLLSASGYYQYNNSFFNQCWSTCQDCKR